MTTTPTTTRPDGDASSTAGAAAVDHHLAVYLETEGRTLIARLRGRLDWVTAPGLRQRIAGGGDWRALVVDLTGLTGLDSHGTSALILAALEARRRNAVMVITVRDPEVTDVLLTVGLGAAVRLVPSVDEAMSLVGSRLAHPSMA